ncbi:MAG TPA: alpha/beta hydrolase [Flavisolibacter sp.]
MKKKIMIAAVAILTLAASTGCKKEFNPSDPGALVPKTVDQDPSIPSIAVNNSLLHAEAFGNPADPMVVYLHGGPGSDYRNAMQIKQLVQNSYYVVFYDQRGCGLSRRYDPDIYSSQLMFDDLTAVIDHYRTSATQKIFLFGHSWGAMLAAGYINAYPSRISGAILSEPGGLEWESIKDYLKNSRKIELFKEALNDVLYIDQFFTGKENQHEILDYKVGVRSAYTYSPGNPEGIEGPSPFWRHGAAILSGLMDLGEKQGLDYTTNLHQYQTKVLLLYGEKNTAYPDQHAQKQAAYFPNAQVHKIMGTGHEMIYFKWDSVYSVVLPYLDSLR